METVVARLLPFMYISTPPAPAPAPAPAPPPILVVAPPPPPTPPPPKINLLKRKREKKEMVVFRTLKEACAHAILREVDDSAVCRDAREFILQHQQRDEPIFCTKRMCEYMLQRLQKEPQLAKSTNQKLTCAEIEEVKSDLLVGPPFTFAHLIVFAGVFQLRIDCSVAPGAILRIEPTNTTTNDAINISLAYGRGYHVRLVCGDGDCGGGGDCGDGDIILFYRHNKPLRAAGSYKVDCLRAMWKNLVARTPRTDYYQDNSSSDIDTTKKNDLYARLSARLDCAAGEFITYQNTDCR